MNRHQGGGAAIEAVPRVVRVHLKRAGIYVGKSSGAPGGEIPMPLKGAVSADVITS